MRTPFSSLSALSVVLGSFLVVSAVSARDFSGSNIGQYSDGPWDQKTTIAVSVLTDQNVLRGNADGTFRANTLLNRAEFITIVMRLKGGASGSTDLSCFPDVSSSAWYAADVCVAKAAGYVRGNAQAGVSSDRWRFEPSRSIQYEEALKILAEIFDIPVSGSTDGMQWYQPYVRAAQNLDIDLAGMSPGDTITRGEMARLAVAFQAYVEGELDELRAAEASSSSSSSRSSQSSSRSSTSSSSSSRSSQSSSSSSSASVDPGLDTSVRSNIVVLGETSPILAGVKFFSNNEPIRTDEIDITMNGSIQSLSQVRVYDSSGKLLGNAVRDNASSSVFTLHLADGAFLVPRRVDTSLYLRGVLKEYEDGGVSGEILEVNNVTLRGHGDWSSDQYEVTSTDTFSASETARAKITGVTNTGAASAALTPGSSQLLAQFRFDAMEGDTQAQVRITDLTLRIEGTGVTLSNVYLRTEGGDETLTCSNSSTVITCTGIPASIGIVDLQKTIRVYGDVALNSGVTNPSLRLTLSDPGTITSDGDITWTDGTSTFDWLPVDTPVVRGTMFN